jgi:5-formyltetrahydrofolate cyclo-ligase
MLIGFYWPFRGEYDPRLLVRSLHAKGARLALPVVVEKAKPLVFREWWPGTPMTKGIWNIVPAGGDPVAPDLLLVPWSVSTGKDTVLDKVLRSHTRRIG